ncbi:hypothetical protein FQN60_006772 [Etheostoma spectabile]|uniref:Uncharacterized protein n=1 Tax=Etheostoma spectabile TaxID=54343 RepID=A0A5J5CGU9_9PERO|nr:hypothetical protein FQN60_006772 [Etheostoma spectabile]
MVKGPLRPCPSQRFSFAAFQGPARTSVC